MMPQALKGLFCVLGAVRIETTLAGDPLAESPQGCRQSISPSAKAEEGTDWALLFAGDYTESLLRSFFVGGLDSRSMGRHSPRNVIE